ncbi:ATP-dependent DNA helicase [Trichonephila clavipes]|nr:ATP-dependent DNA helicase [Trichonephila clavipes]
MPEPNRPAPDINSDVQREHQFHMTSLAAFVVNEQLITAEQRNVYDQINVSITARQGGFFFLDAPGIAATLLDGGRTAHSALKVPLNVYTNPYPMCNIKKHSGRAEVLRKCKIIIWDECTMADKHSLEALDRTLKDIKNNTRLFGGALLLLSGDFRQTLPVIPHLRHNYTDHAWLREQAILAAKNLDVDAINFKIQQSLPGNEITFKSIDTVVDPDEVVNYPVVFKFTGLTGNATT